MSRKKEELVRFARQVAWWVFCRTKQEALEAAGLRG